MNHISMKRVYAKSPIAQDTFQPCMHDKHMHVQLHHDDMLKTTLHMHFPNNVNICTSIQLKTRFCIVPHNTVKRSREQWLFQ